MRQSDPVLIVGAGPTGMTAAMELSRLGIPVRLIDKAKEFSNTSRALAVQARTMELFAQRGLAEEMLRLGNKGRAATIYGDSDRLALVDLSKIESRFNFILLLAQSETERILREQLGRQGVAVERSTELVAFSQMHGQHAGDGTVVAVLKHGDGRLEEVRASYLICAEGAHSLVRQTLQLQFSGKSLPHTYALADLHIEGDLPEDALSIFVPKEGLMAVFPLGGGRYRMIASERGDEAKQESDPDLASMQRLYDRSSRVPGRLHGMIWSSHFHINSRMLDHLRVGRIFFGGDAAHIHSPAGGQGMNTGIQDMINLCWKLALVYDGKAQDGLLDTYESERLPVIRKIVSTTERATDLFDAESQVIHTLLDHVVPFVLQMDLAQDSGRATLSELEASYRGSPLSVGRRMGQVKAGDRMPDLPVQGSMEATFSGAEDLQGMLDPSQFTLLVRAGAEVPDGLQGGPRGSTSFGFRQVIVEAREGAEDKRLDEALGRDGWVLVRPDGYVALMGGSRETIEAWLSRWFLPGEQVPAMGADGHGSGRG